MATIQYRAAGGIVVRAAQPLPAAQPLTDLDVLVLRKVSKGEWVLPKGHVEDGETLEAAALRETCEETGYLHLRLLADLGTLRAEFRLDGRHVIRDETYFLMALDDDARDDAPTHDDAVLDRAIFERHWLRLDEAAERLTFEPARTFMRRAARWTAERASR
jgi:8-oxo-dGTP pyrophosphatase MutT (NUDIX family)